MATYNKNIPRSTDDPSQSQPIIQNNFDQLNTVFGNEHVEFDNSTPGDRGKHKMVTFVDNTTDPGLAYPNSQIYTKSYGVSPNENQVGFIDVTHEDNTNQIVPIHPVAFVRFTSGRVISQQFNVSSITGAGNSYQINFTKALPNANYICVASSQSTIGPSIVIQVRTPATGSVFLVTTDTNDSSSTAFTALHCLIYTVF